MKLLVKLIATCLLVTLFFSFDSSETTVGYAIGDIVADFNLKNVDGKQVSLAGYKIAKGFIVIFTCNHCPFSQAYENRIIELHNKYEKLGYPVIAINPNDVVRSPDDSYENMVARHNDKKYPFVYLHDETQQVAKQYGATRTPHVFILNKTNQGNKLVYIGAIDDNYEDAVLAKEHYVANVIASLMENKQPTKTVTKAIGCSIKWKK